MRDSIEARTSWWRPACLLVLSMLAAGCGTLGAPGPIAATTALPEPAWISFRWAGVDFAGRHEPRAALLVPVTLDGVAGTYYLQLDTGAGWPRWYEVPLRQLLPAVFREAVDSAPDELVLRGRIGATAIVADTFLVEKGFGDSLSHNPAEPRVIGTLGLRFFRNRRLVLDFPRQQLAVVEWGQPLPLHEASEITYVPARYEHGHLFVPFRAAGREVDDFFYDSGASALPLTTTLSTWRELTGRTGTEEDVDRVDIMSWGTSLEHLATPIKGDITFGSLRFVRPTVFAQSERSGRPDFFATAPYRVGGNFGNALFWDRHVVVVDVPGRRFGIAPSR